MYYTPKQNRRMKVILSAAVSLDGCLDDCSAERLRLSSPEDWEAVLKLRADCDAILVGAGTIRKDNPALVIRNARMRAERKARGLETDLVKVTLSRSGELDAGAHFFTEGEGRKIMFVPSSASDMARAAVGKQAEIIAAERISAHFIVETLASRGYCSLMVEGGSQILTMFLTEGVVDELRLAVAPIFVGETAAPRFVQEGTFPWTKQNRMHLARVEQLGDMAVLHYTKERVAASDHEYLKMAVEESRKCVPSSGAYSVGALVVTASGECFLGYTHETGVANHAEEEAIAKALKAGAVLEGATMYSSMEPCSQRKSKPRSCTRLILEHRFGRVVFALYEPQCFVDCQGAELLRKAGLEVVVDDTLADEVRRINAHLVK